MKYLIHFKNRQTPVLSENSCFYKSDTSQMDHKWIYPSISDHYYRVALPEGAKRVEVSATDRFGRISRAAADLK